MNKLIYHPLLKKMVKHINKDAWLNHYVECQVDLTVNIVECQHPNGRYSVSFFEVDLVNASHLLDEDTESIDVLDMLKLVRYSKEIQFCKEHQIYGPYQTYIINEKTMK
jgi:hypothetical protein